jgi:hypothetical protein
MEPLPYMSKRFLLERFLGLTQDEIQKNEEMWREERDNPELSTQSGQDLRSVGITPANLDSDIQTGDAVAAMGVNGGAPMGAPTGPGAVPPAGGVAPPPAL